MTSSHSIEVLETDLNSGRISLQDSKEDPKSTVQVSILSDTSEETVTETNPFADPKVAEHYRGIYEKSNYECKDVFDPDYKWTPEEEKKLVRKLDYRVALTSCILFVALQTDRGNLAQAVADNLLVDLGLTRSDYNLGNTLFLVSFLLAEIPMSLASKKLGPDVFIPWQIIGFSVIAACQFWMTNKAGFLACRVLLGWIEGSLVADLVLWLSYFYKSKELTIRLSWFWTTLSLVTIFTSLLAFGILRMRGVHGYAGWRWLFLIEGIFTFLIGIAGFYLMVPSAVETKNRFHPKGWFTDHEIKIVVNRVLRDDPSKGDMNNRQAVDWKGLWMSLTDYDVWPIYLIGLFAYASLNTTGPYLTLTLKQVGFSTFNVNVLTIPANVIHIIVLLIITWASEKVNSRSLFALILPLWNLPILAAMTWWKGTNINVWGTWTLYTILAGQPYIHAICVSWASRNANSIRTRSIAAAIYNMFVQLGSIYSNNIYKADDYPLYKNGNRTLFIITLVLVPLFLLVRQYYIARNNYKSKKWNAMTPDEQHEYIQKNAHLGNKRLDFQFVY
ncbi:hypothetical protein PSN45_003475 [Yamadazyma tenuis]|uniref:Allantoate permease n=1 Tax=Candida tenuis (strain ATCC 10573 / BCRC 21748 / CBS 615 / JCM 9827 / NBRC 10315 / NRRL Y-1498 / VKM Y-70) TaxID=590646 RepID=G3AY04_CANTC|nr:uncharacterized protein CANTEDRAFT_101734 [Yamadazyma tenuis ATCC 10573]EGV65738.1 hypothetical protein CANTEDRAFT_101734 [Yamadazyma tenuis ATCC 10573]WEJ95944.1 hypothetical protein PSN45_003475 [Yamadazyma tenuis]